MVSFLESVKEKRTTYDMINQIAGNESYRLMMKHHGLTESGMQQVLRSLATGGAPEGKTEKLVRDSLAQDIERLDMIRDFLKRIQEQWSRIECGSLKAALAYLPKEAVVRTKIHFIFGGHSDAYTVGEDDVVLNVSIFLGNLRYLEVILPHELHHMGLSSVEFQKKVAKDTKEEKLNLLLGGTKGEGLATYVMYQTAKAREYEDWTEHFQERLRGVEKHFQAVEAELLETVQGAGLSSKEELYDELFSRIGPAYFVGCRMAEAIEETLGRDALIELMPRPPAEFFLAYNVAAKRRKGEYVFSDRTIEILEELTGK